LIQGEVGDFQTTISISLICLNPGETIKLSNKWISETMSKKNPLELVHDMATIVKILAFAACKVTMAL